MSGHNIATKIGQGALDIKDPGDAGTIRAGGRGFNIVRLVSAAAETRTLARPEYVGGLLTLYMKTDGGDLTLTVTGGYNEDADTSFVFDDVGEFACFISMYDGTDYFWRLISSHAVNILSQTEAGFLEDVTAGTGLASKVVTLDASKDYYHPDAGGIVIGHTAQLTISDGDGATDVVPELQVVGTAAADGSLIVAAYNTTNTRAVAPHLAMVKGGAATIVNTTALADNEVVGVVIAYGTDGVDAETPVAAIQFVVDDVGGPGTGAIGGSLEFYTTADAGEVLTLSFTINNDQNIYVANNNGVVIGHTAQIAAGAVTSEFQMHGTAPADSTALLAAWSADAVPPRLYFAKSRSATVGTFSIITTGDNLGEILAFGDDGVDFNSNANASCAIVFDSAGTIAADRIAGVIRLQTATDAAPSVLTTALTVDQTQTVTCAKGLVVTSATASAITTTRTLTAADSGGVFSVDKQTAYGITLPTPAQGLRFKFLVLDTGANAVTLSDGSAHLFGQVAVNNVATAMTGTTLSLAASGAVGDWVQFEGIDATHYLVTGSCINAGDITIA